MSKEEMEVGKRLAKIMNILPPEARTRLLDHGEGMADMVEVYKQRELAAQAEPPAQT